MPKEPFSSRLRKRAPYLIARGIVRQGLLLGLFFGVTALFPDWGIERKHGWFSWVGYFICYLAAAWLMEWVAKQRKRPNTTSDGSKENPVSQSV